MNDVSKIIARSYGFVQLFGRSRTKFLKVGEQSNHVVFVSWIQTARFYNKVDTWKFVVLYFIADFSIFRELSTIATQDSPKCVRAYVKQNEPGFGRLWLSLHVRISQNTHQ